MEKKRQFITNVIFYLIIAALVLVLCRYVLPVLVPFILGFLIAALVQIPVRKIGGNSPRRRKLAAVAMCVVFYVAFVLLFVCLGTKLVQGLGKLIMAAPDLYQQQVVPVLELLSDRLEDAASAMGGTVVVSIDEMFQEISQNMGQNISDISVRAVSMISARITWIPGAFVRLVVMVVSTFFAAGDFDGIMAIFRRLVRRVGGEHAGEVLQYIKNVAVIYIRSYSLLFFLTFTELCIGFLILKIPYAVGFAICIAIFDILPVLGTGGILLPWAAILVFMGNNSLALGILLLYVVITAIRNTLEPKIVGKQIGLHPLATLVAMFVGLELLGLVGLVGFPVTLAILANLEKNGMIRLFREKKG